MIKIFNYLRKFIFYTTIILLTIIILLPIIGFVVNVEWANSDLKFNFGIFRLIVAPIAALLLILSSIETEDSLLIKISKIIGGVYSGVLIAFIMFILWFASMCAWTSRSPLYTCKENKNIIIIERAMDCGAYDSGNYVWMTYKIQPLTEYFIHAVEVDTTNLNESEWLKIN